MSRRGSQAVMIFAIAISLAGALFLVGAKGSRAAPAKRDVIVARVGKERIYLAALIQATAPYKYRLEQEGYDFGSARGQSLYQQLQENVLNNLIVRTLLAQGAAAQKITLGPAEFEEGFRKELKERKQTEAELRAELKKYGWTMRIFQADLKRRLLEEKFIARLAKGQERHRP